MFCFSVWGIDVIGVEQVPYTEFCFFFLPGWFVFFVVVGYVVLFFSRFVDRFCVRRALTSSVAAANPRAIHRHENLPVRLFDSFLFFLFSVLAFGFAPSAALTS